MFTLRTRTGEHVANYTSGQQARTAARGLGAGSTVEKVNGAGARGPVVFVAPDMRAELSKIITDTRNAESLADYGVAGNPWDLPVTCVCCGDLHDGEDNSACQTCNRSCTVFVVGH